MSDRLDSAIAGARDLDSWNGDRAARVRDRVLLTHAARNRRDKLLRRAALVTGGAGLLVLALLRAASSAPAEPTANVATAATAAPAPTAEMIAARTLGDGGFARD